MLHQYFEYITETNDTGEQEKRTNQLLQEGKLAEFKVDSERIFYYVPNDQSLKAIEQAHYFLTQLRDRQLYSGGTEGEKWKAVQERLLQMYPGLSEYDAKFQSNLKERGH